MATFDDDEMNGDYDNGNGNGNGNGDLENGENGSGNNRNFFLALGILGGLFLVITVVLVVEFQGDVLECQVPAIPDIDVPGQDARAPVIGLLSRDGPGSADGGRDVGRLSGQVLGRNQGNEHTERH